ncbi:hypothetical protein Dda_0601 [Drechslerella dactyloides]|uniref:Cryptic loci regulator 2 N-terminal domain-containing protein n=1 Tax=Drechslerella dactyloides TaxID=74499 RepID=A0AAD6J566_DREDA|nr:hypothetical protein Dda_0601 [Drechslerella dactyloides]
MASSDAVVYSDEGSFALVDGAPRRVLRLNIANSGAVADLYPTNLKETFRGGGAARKPGEKYEWYIRSTPGDSPDVNYRTKLADYLAEQFGFKGDGLSILTLAISQLREYLLNPPTNVLYLADLWVLDRLPPGYQIFTFQKIQVDNAGAEKVRNDHYVYGHPTARFRSPNEMAPHVLSLVLQNQDSLRGLPRNISIPYKPLHVCECQYCPRKDKAKSTMVESSRIRAHRNAAIKANTMQARVEAASEIQDGGWKFRRNEIVWVHQRSETAELGGVWYGAVITSAPDTASFADYANIYTSVQGNRGLYRVQKCGSDAVMTVHTSDIMPWAKTPQPDPEQNITIDYASRAAADHAATGIGVISWEPLDSIKHDNGLLSHFLHGCWLGPEKIWPGDAIRVPPLTQYLDGVSIWDPQQYDILIVRQIIIQTFQEPRVDENGQLSQSFAFFFGGDVLTMYPGPNDKVSEVLDRPVPTYIKTTGQENAKWYLRLTSDDKRAYISAALVHGRFYDPRIIGLIDRRWRTIDARIQTDHLIQCRAWECGLSSINGEPIRAMRRPHEMLPEREVKREEDERLFTEGTTGRSVFSEEEQWQLVSSGDTMAEHELEEYRRLSGALSMPKSREDHQNKKRRTD